MKLSILTIVGTLITMTAAAPSVSKRGDFMDEDPDRKCAFTTSLDNKVYHIGDTITLAWNNGPDSEITIVLLKGKDAKNMLPTNFIFDVPGTAGKLEWKVPSEIYNGYFSFATKCKKETKKEVKQSSSQEDTATEYSGQFQIEVGKDTTTPMSSFGSATSASTDAMSNAMTDSMPNAMTDSTPNTMTNAMAGSSTGSSSGSSSTPESFDAKSYSGTAVTGKQESTVPYDEFTGSTFSY